MRSEILAASRRTITGSSSRVGFETEGGGGWVAWDRYLTLDGERAYHIGNICDTCPFFFERLEGAREPLSPTELSERLRAGLSWLPAEVVETAAALVPDGDYHVLLLRLRPQLALPGGENDYFAHEQVELFGLEPFWGLPHNPRVPYYRAGTARIALGASARTTSAALHQLVVPMIAPTTLDQEATAAYAERFARGEEPTALAVGVLDAKAPVIYEGDPEVTEHWCLAHYLLDGHHKMQAAATNARPLTLLSLVSVQEGLASEDQLEQALLALARGT